jgi:hypothetical protein
MDHYRKFLPGIGISRFHWLRIHFCLRSERLCIDAFDRNLLTVLFAPILIELVPAADHFQTSDHRHVNWLWNTDSSHGFRIIINFPQEGGCSICYLAQNSLMSTIWTTVCLLKEAVSDSGILKQCYMFSLNRLWKCTGGDEWESSQYYAPFFSCNVWEEQIVDRSPLRRWMKVPPNRCRAFQSVKIDRNVPIFAAMNAKHHSATCFGVRGVVSEWVSRFFILCFALKPFCGPCKSNKSRVLCGWIGCECTNIGDDWPINRSFGDRSGEISHVGDERLKTTDIVQRTENENINDQSGIADWASWQMIGSRDTLQGKGFW